MKKRKVCEVRSLVEPWSHDAKADTRCFISRMELGGTGDLSVLPGVHLMEDVHRQPQSGGKSPAQGTGATLHNVIPR